MTQTGKTDPLSPVGAEVRGAAGADRADDDQCLVALAQLLPFGHCVFAPAQNGASIDFIPSPLIGRGEGSDSALGSAFARTTIMVSEVN